MVIFFFSFQRCIPSGRKEMVGRQAGRSPMIGMDVLSLLCIAMEFGERFLESSAGLFYQDAMN